MNFQLTALRQENAGLIRRAAGQAEALQNYHQERNMKKRKGFHPINVDGTSYQYTLSFPDFKAPLVVVYSETSKMEIPLDYVAIPVRKDVKPTWRGKRGDRGFGKYEVAVLIKHYTKEHSRV